MTVDEFLGHISPGVDPAPVIVGPRTHGQDDSAWVADDRAFRARTECCGVEAALESAATATPLIVAMAAWNDPTLPFRNMSQSTAYAWFTGDLKRAYQSTRVPGKRPWPEFAAAVRAGFGFVPADAQALALAARVDIAAIERGGKVIASQRVLDAPFDTSVLDTRSATVVPLGSVCTRAVEQAESTRCAVSNTGAWHHALASALAMDRGRMTARTLAAKVAARQAALSIFVERSLDSTGSNGARCPS